MVRPFFFEPQEQKAAFIQVSNSSDKELRAKSYDELISLRQNVDRFEDQPGMYMPASEQGRRLDRAIQTKNLLD